MHSSPYLNNHSNVQKYGTYGLSSDMFLSLRLRCMGHTVWFGFGLELELIWGAIKINDDMVITDVGNFT